MGGPMAVGWMPLQVDKSRCAVRVLLAGVPRSAYCLGNGPVRSGPVAAGRVSGGLGGVGAAWAFVRRVVAAVAGRGQADSGEHAEASGVRPRSVSDLERGVSRTAHKETAKLLADALGLASPVRALFVAAARGKAPAAEVLAARPGLTPTAFTAAATRTLPRDVASFTGRGAELAQLLGAID